MGWARSRMATCLGGPLHSNSFPKENEWAPSGRGERISISERWVLARTRTQGQEKRQNIRHCQPHATDLIKPCWQQLRLSQSSRAQTSRGDKLSHVSLIITHAGVRAGGQRKHSHLRDAAVAVAWFSYLSDAGLMLIWREVITSFESRRRRWIYARNLAFWWRLPLTDWLLALSPTDWLRSSSFYFLAGCLWEMEVERKRAQFRMTRSSFRRAEDHVTRVRDWCSFNNSSPFDLTTGLMYASTFTHALNSY